MLCMARCKFGLLYLLFFFKLLAVAHLTFWLWLQRVLLHFVLIDVQFHQHCSRDNVTVINDVTGEQLRIACGHHTPADVMASSNRMTVLFKTDHSITGGGFLIKYTARKYIPGRYIIKAASY